MSIFIHIKEFDIEIYLHASNISWNGKPEEEVKKLNIGDEVEAKVMEIMPDDQKIQVSIKDLKNDPFVDAFKGKKVNDILTVKVNSTNSKGIMVSVEGNDLEFLIKKNELAINVEESRNYNRFQAGDRIDVAIASLSMETRKIQLSVKLLEKNLNAEAVSNFGSEASGKNLPFAQLSEKLDNKKKEDK